MERNAESYRVEDDQGDVHAEKCYLNNDPECKHSTLSFDVIRELRTLTALPRHDNVAHAHFVNWSRTVEPPTVSMAIARASLADEPLDRLHDDREKNAFRAALLRGMQFLHGRGVIHRDLKPGNILLYGDGIRNPVLADFGSSVCVCDSAQRLENHMTTYEYAAPEMMRDACTYDAQVDVWSLGVVCAELWLQRRLFYGVHPPTPEKYLECVTLIHEHVVSLLPSNVAEMMAIASEERRSRQHSYA